MRLHVMQIREEPIPAVRTQPLQEGFVHARCRRPVGHRLAPPELHEGLEAAREVRAAGYQRVRGERCGRDGSELRLRRNRRKRVREERPLGVRSCAGAAPVGRTGRAVVEWIEPGEDGSDRRQGPRRLSRGIVEDQPRAGETVELGARTRSRPIAAEPIRSEGIDEKDDDIGARLACGLTLAPLSADEPYVTPSRRAARAAGADRARAEADVHLASRERSEVDTLVEPMLVRAVSRGIEDTLEDLRVVHGNGEPDPRSRPVPRALARDPDAEAERRSIGHADAHSCERRGRGEDRSPVPSVQVEASVHPQAPDLHLASARGWGRREGGGDILHGRFDRHPGREGDLGEEPDTGTPAPPGDARGTRRRGHQKTPSDHAPPASGGHSLPSVATTWPATRQPPGRLRRCTELYGKRLAYRSKCSTMAGVCTNAALNATRRAKTIGSGSITASRGVSRSPAPWTRHDRRQRDQATPA